MELVGKEEEKKREEKKKIKNSPTTKKTTISDTIKIRGRLLYNIPFHRLKLLSRCCGLFIIVWYYQYCRISIEKKHTYYYHFFLSFKKI